MGEWYIIVASGPSLQRKDAEALRYAGVTVAINCSVFFVPWAKFLFAADAVWWRYYTPKIPWYQGHRISRSYRARGIEQWRGKNWARTGGNSGHMAIQYAVDQGAERIALLGFDQSKTDGKAHFHADHPKKTQEGARTNMANAGGIAAWPRLMAKTAVDLQRRGIEVVNLSRQTALTCFPRVTVEQFLEDLKPCL
jgi:hypothetical protein